MLDFVVIKTNAGAELEIPRQLTSCDVDMLADFIHSACTSRQSISCVLYQSGVPRKKIALSTLLKHLHLSGKINSRKLVYNLHNYFYPKKSIFGKIFKRGGEAK